jgi:hypothetical protein
LQIPLLEAVSLFSTAIPRLAVLDYLSVDDDLNLLACGVLATSASRMPALDMIYIHGGTPFSNDGMYSRTEMEALNVVAGDCSSGCGQYHLIVQGLPGQFDTFTPCFVTQADREPSSRERYLLLRS